jgi:hypothetical protein
MGIITDTVARLSDTADPTAAGTTCAVVAVLVLAVAVHIFVLRVSGSSNNNASGGAGFTWKEVPPTVPPTATNSSEAASGHARLVATRLPVSEQRARASTFHKLMSSRRSLRFFSPDPVDDQVLATAIATAGTAPSGAHKQPWVFCVVRDSSTKHRIRELVEAEELVNYERRMKKASRVAVVQPTCRHSAAAVVYEVDRVPVVSGNRSDGIFLAMFESCTDNAGDCGIVQLCWSVTAPSLDDSSSSHS